MNRTPKEKNSELPLENASGGGMYYTSLANTYHHAGRVLLILLVCFLVIAFLFAGGSLNVLSFRYLFKYIPYDPSAPDREQAEITYAAGSNARFVLFHDDLAVLGEGKAALYSPLGDLVFRSDIEKGTPALAYAGETLAAYVPGKSLVTFFHSFGKTKEIRFPAPVSSVDLSANGIVAVQTKESSDAVFHILNSRLETETTVSHTDGIVMNTALSPDGKTLAVLSLAGENGAFRTVLSLIETGNGKLVHTEHYTSAKPSALAFFDDGRFFVLLDSALLFYDNDGDRKESFSLAPIPHSYHTDGKNLILLSESGELSLYKSRGKCLFSKGFGTGILDAKTENDACYLLSETAIFTLDKEGDTISTFNIKSGVLDYFLLRDGSILLCYPTETKQVP